MNLSRFSSKQRVRVGEYGTSVLSASFDLRASTRVLYQRAWAVHCLPHIGKVAVTDLNPAMVREWFAALVAVGVGPQAIRTSKSVASRVMHHAVTDGLVTHNPVRGVATPSPNRREVRPLTPSQVETLALTITPRYRVAVLVSAYAGLRIGEVGGLQVEDLDLLRQRLSVRRSVSGREVGETKTKASNRTVALPAFLTEELVCHAESFPPTDGRVFTTRTGGLLTANEAWKPFKRAAVLAGVPDARWHDLRHTAASLAIAAGGHPKAIQARLGHADIGTTLNVYGHLFEGFDGPIADALNLMRPLATSARGTQ